MTEKRVVILRYGLLILIGSLLSGCGARQVIVVTATPSLAPTIIPASATPTPIPAPAPIRLWIAPDTPPELETPLDMLISAGRCILSSESDAEVKLTHGQTPGGLNAEWVWVPVAPFPTAADGVTWADIQRFWGGDPASLNSLADSKPLTLIVTRQSQAYLTGLLGPGSPVTKVEAAGDDLASALWDKRPALALVPFHRLTPKMKALTLDGASVFDRALDLGAYPLTQHFTLTGDPDRVRALTQEVLATGKWLATNRDLSKMVALVMTGTTALTRATAFHMEQEGITLPARDILPFLQDADLVHTSNEVSFSPRCPAPDPTYHDDSTQIFFCSKDSYFDLLKAIHLNIVEVTGNHVNDWGTDALSHTLDLYDANQMLYFGGGRNDSDARKALVLKRNNLIISFIGCNPVGPVVAWATADKPGAATCDDDFLSKEIPRLKAVANVVIMTLQYQEYYQNNAPDDQVEFFKKYADWGADIVFGSQAHVPQGFAFEGGAFIHYGTGNLFFDQMDSLDTRQMFADKFILYDGKHISTVLFTGLSEDYSRPRPMTGDERRDFLKKIFAASGW